MHSNSDWHNPHIIFLACGKSLVEPKRIHSGIVHCLSDQAQGVLPIDVPICRSPKLAFRATICKISSTYDGQASKLDRCPEF
jgi:hypothetical protein